MINLQIKESWHVRNINKVAKYIIIKLLKTNDKEKNFKAVVFFWLAVYGKKQFKPEGRAIPPQYWMRKKKVDLEF